MWVAPLGMFGKLGCWRHDWAGAFTEHLAAVLAFDGFVLNLSAQKGHFFIGGYEHYALAQPLGRSDSAAGA